VTKPGLDVWEVIETLRNCGNRVERAARYLDIGEEEVRAAVAHDRAHPSEVAKRLRRERRIAEDATG
jgi:hypothetical protein